MKGSRAVAAAKNALLVPLLLPSSCATYRQDALQPSSLVVPYDSSHDQIELAAVVKGQPVRLLLDTGVDPSAIDLADARKLNLPLSEDPAGSAAGVGNANHPIYPSQIVDLQLGGVSLGNVDAAAMDMSALQRAGRAEVDGVLGYSFISSRVLLVDYPRDRLFIFADSDSALAWARRCARRHRIPLATVPGDTIPVIPHFRFGESTAPVSIDTGSGQTIGLLKSALRLPSLVMGLDPGPAITITGARGTAQVASGRLKVPIGFGPFNLPQGQPVHVRPDEGSSQTRVANVGNRTLKQMGISLLLDYPRHRITFLGDCRVR